MEGIIKGRQYYRKTIPILHPTNHSISYHDSKCLVAIRQESGYLLLSTILILNDKYLILNRIKSIKIIYKL